MRRAWQPTPVFLPGESPWTEEPGRLQSMGSQRVRHDWVANTSNFIYSNLILTYYWFFHLFQVYLIFLSFPLLFKHFLISFLCSILYYILCIYSYYFLWKNSNITIGILDLWEFIINYSFYNSKNTKSLEHFNSTYPHSLTFSEGCILLNHKFKSP